MGKSWKAYERWVAKKLGTTRIPVLGREGADIEADNLWIDCKHRVEVPKGYHDLLEHAEALGYGKIAFNQNGQSFFISRIDTLEDSEVVRTTKTLAEKPIEWLAHIGLSAEPHHTPLIIMCRSRRPYKESVAVGHWRNHD